MEIPDFYNGDALLLKRLMINISNQIYIRDLLSCSTSPRPAYFRESI